MVDSDGGERMNKTHHKTHFCSLKGGRITDNVTDCVVLTSVSAPADSPIDADTTVRVVISTP